MIARFLFLILLVLSFPIDSSAQVKEDLERSRLEVLSQIERLETRANNLKLKLTESNPIQTKSTVPNNTIVREFTLDTTIIDDEKDLKELLNKYYISSLHGQRTQDDHLTQVYVQYMLDNHNSVIQVDTIWSEQIVENETPQIIKDSVDSDRIRQQYNETIEELKAYQMSYKNINRTLDFLLYGGIENNNPSTSQSNNSTSSFEREKGFHQWPMLSSRITKRFGNTVHPEHAHITISNNGIDISSDSPEVRNIFDGEVAKVEQNGEGLYIVIIAHDGNYNSVYSDLSTSYVSTGQYLTKNSPIGEANSGKSGKKEIHFEIWEGTQVQNPIHWLKNN